MVGFHAVCGFPSLSLSFVIILFFLGFFGGFVLIFLNQIFLDFFRFFVIGFFSSCFSLAFLGIVATIRTYQEIQWSPIC